MNRIYAAAMLLAASSLSACSVSHDNNQGTSLTVNGQTIQNGMNDAGNFARDAGNVAGNTAVRAGEIIENGARTAWNATKEGVRDLNNALNGRDEPAGNSAAKN